MKNPIVEAFDAFDLWASEVQSEATRIDREGVADDTLTLIDYWYRGRTPEQTAMELPEVSIAS